MTRLFSIVLLLTHACLAYSQPKGKEPAANNDDLARAVLAFDPGSHTRPISALGFSKDHSKLITVGWDYSVQVWSTKTGERLDILRLPAFGRDNGYDKDRWSVAAVSPNGEFVAIGGAPKFLWDEKNTLTRLLIVDVPNRRVRKNIIGLGPNTPITALAFTADGNRLAVGTGSDVKSVYIIDEIARLMRVAPDGKRPAGSAPKLVSNVFMRDVSRLAISASGDRIAVGELGGQVTTWNISGKAVEGWKKLGEFNDANRTDVMSWAPDGSHFARGWVAGGGAGTRGIELRAPDGKQLKKWTYSELAPGFVSQSVAVTFRYLAADRLFISAHGGVGKGEGSGALGVVLDPTTGKTLRRFSEPEARGMFTPVGATTENGELAATTSSKGLEAVVYSLADGKIVARCGSRSPIPTIVGWTKDLKAPGFAWSDTASLNSQNSDASQLGSAFNLSSIEPMGNVVPADYEVRRLKWNDWTIESRQVAGNFLNVLLKKGQEAGERPFAGPAQSLTLVPNGEKPPLLAFGYHDSATQMGSYVHLVDHEGTLVADWFPMATTARDMVSSPDGRYVLVSTGTHRLSIYRTNGSRFPFLNFVQTNGEWVIWSPEGYYAASPGGEKLIGWAVTNGANALVTYYPVERFAKHYRRPDLIKLAIEKGSMKEALAILKTAPTAFEEILPPTSELSLLKQEGSKLQVKAVAKSRTAGKPVKSIQLLLDGRPLSEGKGLFMVGEGKPAEATWEVTVPGGKHELRLLASTYDGGAISDPLLVVGPKTPGQQPSLFRVCVGINDYDEQDLKLKAATKDAKEVFQAFESNCTGPYNRFGAAKGELLLDKQATRKAVLDSLNEVRKAAKPGDLVVMFFAGHGHKQENEFYLLTKEADTSKSLEGNSLSGKDLRKALGEMECPVLLIMDACHSAKGVQAFRPATDDLARNLTDESIGVTVMAAAMAHEVAKATAENGFFTAGLLKALKADAGVPFDPYERALYTHHIYSVVFSEVRNASNGKQNPFLNSPWTIPPLVVREIAK